KSKIFFSPAASTSNRSSPITFPSPTSNAASSSCNRAKRSRLSLKWVPSNRLDNAQFLLRYARRRASQIPRRYPPPQTLPPPHRPARPHGNHRRPRQSDRPLLEQLSRSF